MTTSVADSAASHSILPLEASSPYLVGHLSDAELLTGTRVLVARSNHQLACLLAHLAEVEARGIHRTRACSSLYAYCQYELRFSEDSAFRHARAARLARKFPILLEQLAAGEIHLSGLLLLGPHLTEENHREVLQLAKHRSKREIAKLVRRLDPLPDVPPRIEPLGPARPELVTRGTWSAFMEALSPVRELAPGECPRDWMNLDANGAAADDEAAAPQFGDPEAGSDSRASTDSGTSAPWLKPQRYSVQFTASQEYVDLVERAKDLLSHAVPNRSLAEVQLRAMRLLVSELEKRKYAVGRKPRVRHGSRRAQAEASTTSVDAGTPESERDPEKDTPQKDVTSKDITSKDTPSHDAVEAHAWETNPGEVHGGEAHGGETDSGEKCGPNARNAVESERAASTREGRALAPSGEDPRRRGERVRGSKAKNSGRRAIAADTRREVRERDGARCAYVAADGQRCRETSFLELHHHDPHARGGEPVAENLTLYCRSHNALAAEGDFGRAFMANRSGRRE